MVNATLEAPPESDVKPMLPHLFAVTRVDPASNFPTVMPSRSSSHGLPIETVRKSSFTPRRGGRRRLSIDAGAERTGVVVMHRQVALEVGKKSPHNGDALLRFLARQNGG